MHYNFQKCKTLGLSAWLPCNNGRWCTKSDDDDGKWPVDGGVMYTLFPTDSTVLSCFRRQKGVGVTVGNTLMAKVPSTTSELTESQEMAKDMFNGTYCKHSNLSSSLKAFKIRGTLPENNAYKKILLKSTL